MDLQVSIHHGPFLLLVGVGRARVCDYLGLVELLSAVTLREGHHRALIDAKAVDQNLSEPELREVAERAAKALGHLDRVALVVGTPGRLAATQSVARSAGEHFRIFLDLRDASEWIQEV